MNTYHLSPNKFIAMQVRDAQANRIKKSISYLVTECANKLKIKDRSMQLALSKIMNTNRLLPEIHYLHSALQSAMRSQNIVDVKNCLLKLTSSLCKDCPTNEEISITSIGDSAWENFTIKEAIRLTSEDLGRKAEIRPVEGSKLALAINELNAALNMLARYDSCMLDEIQEQVKIIKLFRGKVTRGLTDVRILGAMLIRLPDQDVNPLLYFLEHVLHEASHIHLNCLMSIDPLILNSNQERFLSPLRPDPRPMVGVFHATFVSARIARSFMTLYNKTKDESLLQTLAETLDETIRGISEVKKYAKLTIHGYELVNSICEFIELARRLPIWKFYDFSAQNPHRFGVGATKVNELWKAVA